jgi:hypothetical protein
VHPIRSAAFRFLLGLCALATGCGQSSKSDGVVWTDPEGDVQGIANLPDRPTPDLRKVAIGSEAGQLTVELDVKSLWKRLEYAGPDGRRYGASLIDLLVDADHDPATGGAPMTLWRGEQKPSRFGYEYRVAVLAGFRYQTTEGGSGRTTGDVFIESAGKSKIEPIVMYQVWSLAAQRFGSRNVELSEADKARMDTELATLDGDRVRIRIPYAYLGVKPGGKLRVAYLDVQESATRESSLSTDQTLKLK